MSLLLLLVTVVGLATAYEDKTVVECLKGNGNFSVLSALIDKAGLTSRLSSTGKFYNIFLIMPYASVLLILRKLDMSINYAEIFLL